MVKVSIGLPVFNGERFIHNALESLLAQDFEDFELIICDNASTDNTYKICQEYALRDSRIRLYRNDTNIGATKNFELVFQLSSAPYFMWAAHDDMWADQFIRLCIEKLEQHPDAVMCCTEILFVNQDGTHRASWSYSNLDTQGMVVAKRVKALISLMGWYAIYGLLRREAVEKLDLTIDSYGCDVVWILQLLLQGDCLKVPEILFYYRLPDRPKTELEYQEINNPKKAGAITLTPRSDMAKQLLAVSLGADLDWVVKRQILDSFIYVLSFKNPVWFNEMAAEQGITMTMATPQRKRQRFVEEILGAREALRTTSDEKPKKVLVFFPHNPWPAKSGANYRCLTVLEALSDLGYAVTLVSSNITSDTPWQSQSIEQLHSEIGIETLIYVGDQKEIRQIADASGAVHADLANLGCWENMYITEGLRAFFHSVYERLQPEVVLVNYSLWANLVDDMVFEKTCTIVDTLDLFTLNLKMQKALRESIQNQHSITEILNEDFFAVRSLEAESKEFALLDRFDCTLAVAPAEAKLMEAHTQHTQVVCLPITSAVIEIKNTYTGAPIFVVGPNSFNQQGYLYFIHRVLPQVLQELPEFRLRIVGGPSASFQPHEGVELLGYIPDLHLLYTDSRFAICPLIGGTGQQVKILEAMAHGVPVISLQNVAASSPIIHDINGLIAKNAQEFAKYTIQLFRDRTLCNRLGKSSRPAIFERYSDRQLKTDFTKILARISDKKFPEVVGNKINQYIAFPDWSQDEESLLQAIADLFKSWLLATQNEPATLFLYSNQDSIEIANDCLTYVLATLIMEDQVVLLERQNIEVLSSMPPVKWQKCLDNIQSRFILGKQNNLAVLTSGAWCIPVQKVKSGLVGASCNIQEVQHDRS
jgi:glycosyltransferase involved in cell wall biosynthesis